MRSLITSLIVLGGTAIGASVFAAGEQWKDGMLFTEDGTVELKGHSAVAVTFGLEPGKCTGELTAPSEWLKMTEGTLTFAYPGKDDVERSAGTEWFHAADTKVEVCNKSDQNAVLVGVQFRPS